jgi:thermolabile hemolysin
MFSILIYLIIILSNHIFSNTQKLPFDTIVSFGDGNTDTGNVFSLTNHQWPPTSLYYQGHFTNGLMWIEKLGISNIINYAYSGATIDNDNLVVGYTPPNRTIVPGVRQQIVLYLANNDIASVDLARTLYVIWAGANDYLDNSSLSSDLVVASFMNAVNDLVFVGVKNLLIINLPPLQSYPTFNGSNKTSTLITRILYHNNYLLSNISQTETIYNKKFIKIFDLYSLITNILSNNSTEKLNTMDACWNIVNYSIKFQCLDPDDYVFIDDYHFTTSIHQTISDNIRQFLLSSSSYDFSVSKLSIFICIIVFIIKLEYFTFF